MWIGEGCTGRGDASLIRGLLLIEPDDERLEMLRAALGPMGWFVHAVRSVEQAQHAIGCDPTVLACHVASSAELEVARRLKALGKELPVVVYADATSSDDILASWRAGASDFVGIDRDGWLDSLVAALERSHGLTETSRAGRTRLAEEQRKALIGVARQRLELRHARRQHRGAVVRLQTTAEDLREELRVHERLEIELTEERERLQSMGLATGNLLRDIGAEIKSPLDAILGAVDDLLDEDSDEVICRQALRICAEARRLSSTVNDVLELARLEDGTVPVHRSPVDLLPFVVELLDEVHRQADSCDVELALHVQASVGAAWLDVGRLRPALVRLLHWVVEQRTQHTLQVALTRESDQVVMAVHPVDIRPGTWRAAELLRCLGGSLSVEGGRLEIRLSAAELPSAPAGHAFKAVEQLTPQVLTRVRRAIRAADDRQRRALEDQERREYGSARASGNQTPQTVCN